MEIKIFTKLKNGFINFMKEKLLKNNVQTEADKFLQNLSDDQKKLGSRMFDLVIGRVLKVAYLNLAEAGRGEMERVFLSDDAVQKENFIKKNIPNFKKIFDEEAKKLNEEIKLEIEKQF